MISSLTHCRLMPLASSNILLLLCLLAWTGNADDTNNDVLLGTGEPGPLKVGEEYAKYVSPLEGSSILPELTENGQSATYHVRHTGASYIAIHFTDFDLDEGCTMTVSGEPLTNLFGGQDNGKQEYVMKGQGKMGLRSFWAQHVKGGRISLKVRCERGNALEKGWFEVDKYAAGYSTHSGNLRRHLTMDETKSQDERRTAICGNDDKENAVCYKTSHETEYSASKAVARLLITGSSLCTGWLASNDNHLITNEHCIGNSDEAANTDYEFMGEAPNCGDTNGQLWYRGDIRSGGTLVRMNAALDYALVRISTTTDLASIYGFLVLESTREAILGEQIYIPQYPGGRAKELGLIDTLNAQNTCVVDSVTTSACSGGSAYNDVGYRCDTEGGSSGSPVISRDTHKVLALHHCANCPNRGVPITLVFAEIQNDLPLDGSCGDGICEVDKNESCATCPGDCTGINPGSDCGNGICEAGNNENCVNCPQDCNGVQSGKPDNRYCCGDGGGEVPVSCVDSRCGSDCTDVPKQDEPYCCGDGLCQGPGEDENNCISDCFGVTSPPTTSPPACGDKNVFCMTGSDCCSGNCRGNNRCA